jgi:hypothetical protein
VTEFQDLFGELLVMRRRCLIGQIRHEVYALEVTARYGVVRRSGVRHMLCIDQHEMLKLCSNKYNFKNSSVAS